MPPIADVQHIKANFNNGMLDVTVPKSTEGTQKRISIE
jgi:HSP20 family molecular chaperone IbpA